MLGFLILTVSVFTTCFLCIDKNAEKGIKETPIKSAVSGYWNNYAASSYAGGNGTESSPYKIATAAQLAYLSSQAAKADVTGYYILTENIDLSAHYWIPIGLQSYSFKGNFNGDFYSITGMNIYEASYSSGLYKSIYGNGGATGQAMGLFGCIAGATVQNLVIKNSMISTFESTTSGSGSYSIGLAVGHGHANSILTQIGVVDSTIQVKMKPGRYNIGGLIGECDYSDVYRCFFKNSAEDEIGILANVTPTSSWYLGGLIGIFQGSSTTRRYEVVDSFCASSIQTEFGSVGGVAGDSNWGIFANCYYSGHGELILGKNKAGGIVGGELWYTNLYSCFSHCETFNMVGTGTKYKGGIFAYATISHSSSALIKGCAYYKDPSVTLNAYGYSSSTLSSWKYKSFTDPSLPTLSSNEEFYTSSTYLAADTTYPWDIGGSSTTTTVSVDNTWSRISGEKRNGCAWYQGLPLLTWYEKLNCEVTFHANGGTILSGSDWEGSGEIVTKTVSYNSTYGTLPTPSRAGYKFNGWAGNMIVSHASTVTNSTSYCFFSSTLTEDLQSNTTYAFVTEIKLSQAPTGENWAGIWLDGGYVNVAMKYDVGTSWVTWRGTFTTGDVSTYSHGGKKVINVYNGPSSQSASKPMSMNYFALYKVSDSANIEPSPSTSSAFITSSSKNTTVNNHTLYASWTLYSCEVSFNPQGGSVSPTTKTAIYNSTYGTLPTPTLSGYTFAGWFTSTSYTSQVTASTTVTNTSAHTLYAKWTYTITYKANNGSGTVPSSVTKTKGTSTTLPTNSLTRTGFTANGWNTSSTLKSTPSYASGASYSGGNVTLYANWTPISVNVTVGFKFEDDIFGNTYEAAVKSGFSCYVGYYTTTISGSTTTSTSKDISCSSSSSTAVTMRGTQTINLSSITCPTGWVCVGYELNGTKYFTTSSLTSKSLSIGTSATTINLLFKKVSENRLEYQ